MPIETINEPSLKLSFQPTHAAALQRLDVIDRRAADAYARTRNHLDGAVTKLSPYLTHGVLTLPQVAAHLREQGVPADHKLMFELAWREYWQHAWRHLGEGIFGDRKPPPYSGVYADAVPADVMEARCGVPVIDAAVRGLYDTGYVHNHARMWLASYLIHLRKVHWRAGADWLIAHLLDGDLASNHLSWQWVAGAYTGKPYLFNDENVARYAPALALSRTTIDRSYDDLAYIAASTRDVGPERGATGIGVEVPAVFGALAFDTMQPSLASPLPTLTGRTVALMHPWCLRPEWRQQADVVVAVIHSPGHLRFPWSARRWTFVQTLMTTMADAVVVLDLADTSHPLRHALSTATQVVTERTLMPGYVDLLPALATETLPVPRVFAEPVRFATSFSKFWAATNVSDRA